VAPGLILNITTFDEARKCPTYYSHALTTTWTLYTSVHYTPDIARHLLSMHSSRSNNVSRQWVTLTFDLAFR